MRVGERFGWLVLWVAFCFFAGCEMAAPLPKPVSIKEVRGRFSRGETEAALKMIDGLLRGRISNPDRARLEVWKGICLEAQGKLEEADDWYSLMLTQFPKTSFAEWAEIRLQREDGDQKERPVLFEAPDRNWQMTTQWWSRVEFEIVYQRKNELEQDHLRAFSHDLEGEFATLEKAVERFRGTVALDQLDVEELERGREDAMFLIKGRVPGARAIGMARVFATAKRIHMVDYTKLGDRFLEEERREIVARLKGMRVAATPVGKK